MRKFNILTPGEKIKNIRKKFNIKQEDLTGGEITRNLISIIENNKANLTEATANILANNINRICKERNIEYSITDEYLLEDEVAQAKEIVNEYISYIDNMSAEDIDKIKDMLYEIEFFFKNYNAGEKRAELYIVIGKKFKLNRQCLKAFDYYLKAFESSEDKKSTISSLLNLGICSIYLSKYEDAINYLNLILDLNADKDMEYYARFNIALSYKKLGKFEEALKVLIKLTENYSDIINSSVNKYVDVILLKGGCLYKLKAFNKSIETYNEALKLENLGANEILILASLAEVYCTTRDFVSLEKINDKLMNKLNSKAYFLGNYEGYMFLSLAKNIKEIGKENDKVLELFLKSLKCIKSGKSAMYFEDIESLFNYLLDIFIKNQDEEKITYLKKELFELIEKQSFPRITSVTLKFIQYYNLKGKSSEIDNLIELIAG